MPRRWSPACFCPWTAATSPSTPAGRRTDRMSTNRDALFDLTGKIVVVTGAGGGLGTAICSGLAAYGADVALVDLDAASLEKAAASVAEHGRRAAAIEADASDEAAVGRA